MRVRVEMDGYWRSKIYDGRQHRVASSPNETVLKRHPLSSINIALTSFFTSGMAQKCSISKRYTGWLSRTERITKNTLSLFPKMHLQKLLNERHGLFTYAFGGHDILLFRSHSILSLDPPF
jgi:hypothetical protein